MHSDCGQETKLHSLPTQMKGTKVLTLSVCHAIIMIIVALSNLRDFIKRLLIYNQLQDKSEFHETAQFKVNKVLCTSSRCIFQAL